MGIELIFVKYSEQHWARSPVSISAITAMLLLPLVLGGIIGICGGLRHSLRVIREAHDYNLFVVIP